MANDFILAASFAVMLLSVSESMMEKYIATKMGRYSFSISILAIGILPLILAAFFIHFGHTHCNTSKYEQHPNAMV